jgi:hypothetical protein
LLQRAWQKEMILQQMVPNGEWEQDSQFELGT